jgi:signal transduction histidine kinase
MWLAEDRDRVAIGLNDAVVRRLFTAGLTLESALALMDNHPAAGKIRSTIAELDLAIREIRQVIFDSHGAAPPSGWGAG